MLSKLILISCLEIISYQLKTCGIDQSLYQGQCVQNSCVESYVQNFQEITYDSTFIGRTKISTDIDVGNDTSGNAVITISFIDNVEGSTNVDNSMSCITPVHSTYTINHGSKTFDFNPIIKSTFNKETGKRAWQYTIFQSTYYNTLITAIKNYTHLIYVGFYGIDFNILDQTSLTFLYSFQITVALKGSNINNLLYQLLTRFNTVQCQTYNPQINCISNNSTELYFCATSNCENPYTQIALAINQTFWLLVNITEPFYSSYQLLKPTIEIFSGQQLIKAFKPTQSSVSIGTGFTIIQVFVDFAYKDVNFIVSTTLSTKSLTDLNVSNTVSMRMYAQSSQISCIQNSAGICISCSDQCLINKGSADYVCQNCTNQELACPQGTAFNGLICVSTSNSNCSTKYKSRFFTDEMFLYPINFNPQVSFSKNTTAVATISFDDLETDGLIYSDNNQSCIVAQHFLYSENFESPQTIFYASIKSVYIKLNNKRYWVYNLPILTSNDSDRLIYYGYYGYYGINFNIEGKTLAKLQFSFQAAFSNPSQSVVISNFDQLLACQNCLENSETFKHLITFFVLILGI